VSDHASVEPPPVGCIVWVDLQDGRPVPTTVTASGETTIEVALPPVVAPGTQLRLRWSASRGSVRAAGRVAAGSDTCLRLVLGAASRRDRREATRSTPPQPLMVDGVRIAVRGRSRTPLRGAVRDLSASGFAFWTDDPIGVGDLVEVVIQPLDAAPTPPLQARVVRVAQATNEPTLVGCALRAAADASQLVMTLLRASRDGPARAA
jgi:hypothetical protein